MKASTILANRPDSGWLPTEVVQPPFDIDRLEALSNPQPTDSQQSNPQAGSQQEKEQPPSSQQEKEQPPDSQQEKEQPPGSQQSNRQPPDSQQEKEQPPDSQQEKEQPPDSQQEKEQPPDSQQEKEQPPDSQQEKEQPTDSRQEKEQPTDSRQEKEQPTDSQQEKEQPTDSQQEKEQRARPQQEKEQRARPQQEKEQPTDSQQEKEQSADSQQLSSQEQNDCQLDLKLKEGEGDDKDSCATSGHPVIQLFVMLLVTWFSFPSQRHPLLENCFTESASATSRDPSSSLWQAENTVGNCESERAEMCEEIYEYSKPKSEPSLSEDTESCLGEIPPQEESDLAELTIPEVRCLLEIALPLPVRSRELRWAWSVFRRSKRQQAKRSHYRCQGLPLPSPP